MEMNSTDTEDKLNLNHEINLNHVVSRAYFKTKTIFNWEEDRPWTVSDYMEHVFIYLFKHHNVAYKIEETWTWSFKNKYAICDKLTRHKSTESQLNYVYSRYKFNTII